MRRPLSLAVASAMLALAVAGFLGGGAERTTPGAPSHRAVASPLVELQAVPAAAPRVDVYAAVADVAALLTSAAVLLIAAGYIVRERRRRTVTVVPVWSASLRGPPRLAAL